VIRHRRDIRRDEMRHQTGWMAVALAGVLLFSASCGVKIFPVGEAPRITNQKLMTLLEDPGIVIVDLRHDLHWEKSTEKIPGAVRGTPKDVSWAKKYPKDTFLVLYCACSSEQTSAIQTEKLMDKKYTKVFALKGGWWEWVKDGYPVEAK
jgi:rhodanese-related sulfurtransferase